MHKFLDIQKVGKTTPKKALLAMGGESKVAITRGAFSRKGSLTCLQSLRKIVRFSLFFLHSLGSVEVRNLWLRWKLKNMNPLKRTSFPKDLLEWVLKESSLGNNSWGSCLSALCGSALCPFLVMRLLVREWEVCTVYT